MRSLTFSPKSLGCRAKSTKVPLELKPGAETLPGFCICGKVMRETENASAEGCDVAAAAEVCAAG